jgi:hypothetical protein
MQTRSDLFGMIEAEIEGFLFVRTGFQINVWE